MDIMNVASVSTINIGLIQDGDHTEVEKLFLAAKNEGVFYLDLEDQRFSTTLTEVDDIFRFSRELFQLGEREKLEYDVDDLSELKVNGYKPIGRNNGGMKGSRDGFESYVIPGKAHLDSTFTRPPLISERLPILLGFFSRLHDILDILLSSLSTSCGLPKEVSLNNFHRRDVTSTDCIRFLHYIAQPLSETGSPQAAHTDLGSLTLLFARTPGLQVLPRDGTEWAYVMPKPSCLIVNIGDGLSMLTGGLLTPCLHRVSPYSKRSMEERYSIAYLQRAEDNVRMESLLPAEKEPVGETEVLTSREWLEKKFGILRRKVEV